MTATKQSKYNKDQTAKVKEQNLRSMMQELGSVLVAYSGGVDSSYLALIATQELGEKALCITGISPSVSEVQREQAKKVALEFKFNYETIKTDEIDDAAYMANPVNRCYFCKTELYGKLQDVAADRGFGSIVDGANADDMNDYRPGKKAAQEKGVRSVLAEVGFSKAEIRERSEKLGLETWDKPASPCLASRIQYGVPVSIERLSKVEKGEAILRDLGFVEFRVRYHEELARIEISEIEMQKVLVPDVYKGIANSFQNLGFKYVTLDLHGFRSGSMNEVISENLKSIETGNSFLNQLEN